MPLKPQSIRRGVTIKLDGNVVEKQAIIDLSNDWSENQIEFFKKMLKQGGERTFNGSFIQVIAKEATVNSQGEKDGGKIVYPSDDMRF